MIVADDNYYSQNGVSKVGFKKTGQIVKKIRWKKHVIV